MDDLETINALERCAGGGMCNGCPAYEGLPGCRNRVLCNSLDLINRQRAEIEKLSNHILELTKMIKSASSAPAMCYDSSVEVIRKASIDNILREMEANR